MQAYDAAFEQLRAANLVFPCHCSRSELAASGGIHRDGRCVGSTFPARIPAWFLRTPDVDVGFDDLLLGPQQENLHERACEFVIRRADGLYSYQLACVVDGAFQCVTEVVCGQDLRDSTARQIWLQRCLDLPTPSYRHLALALDTDGHRLSKSSPACPIDPSEPTPALRRALAFLKLQLPSSVTSPDELLAHALAHFDPAHIAQQA